MSIANQQTLAESEAQDRPPVLEKGSYMPWASQFLTFLDNKREEGELMRRSIDKVPYYYADIKVMNYILQGIPNDIYNSVYACKDAQTMWNRIKRLMQGTTIDISTLINIIDRNEFKPFEISINTKLLNSLQPEWSKYVTLTRQKFNLETKHYNVVYDYLSQFEPHVKASKAKKEARNHDPLALVANSHANQSYSHVSPSYSCSPQPYYVTHPSSVIDYDDVSRGDTRRCSERKAFNCNDVIGMSYHSTKNVGHVGYGGSKNRVNSEKDKCSVLQLQWKVHYARECPKPRVRDAKYFREHMLLATKDEAGVHLDDEENDFMLINAYGDDTLEELNASVIMMARIQPADNKSDVEPKYDVEFISEVNASQVDMINGLLSKSGHEH
ncbi:hypothetical protein Tco_1109487 [Tanacetum coccineum]